MVSNLVVLLVMVGTAASCSSEPRQLARLRAVAATLPVPDGADLFHESFVANTPEMFGDEEYRGSLQYLTLAEVDLEDATADVLTQFESAGWSVTNLTTDFVHENLAVHKGTFQFSKGADSGSAILDYAIPPVGTPMKKPARVVIVFSLTAT